MTAVRELITNFEVMSEEVHVGDGAPLKDLGKGTVTLSLSDERGGYDIRL